MENNNRVSIVGKNGITATVIQDSSSSRTGTRITTFELEYPRFIHSEFMTHRMLSRNAASSRAIPVDKLVRLVETSCAEPVEWGKNQKGMQSTEKLGLPATLKANVMWRQAAEQACTVARALDTLQVHKQIVNRTLEPYQMIKVVCTATSYDNFFYLRNHPDAQPEIRELATVMLEALSHSRALTIGSNEWHVPYIEREYNEETGIQYYILEEQENLERQLVKVFLTPEQAVKISASCCAQVSYRVLNTDIAKANSIFDRLVTSKPVHASPLEHQATPITNLTSSCNSCDSWERGVTHSDRGGGLWSGNFKDWIQHRQLIPDNVCDNYRK